MAATPLQRIVIIGGGFSGTVVAVQLLRKARAPLAVTLLERSPEIGRGVAYRTECPDNLLNVPVEKMGAFPEDPEHFFRWLGERLGRSGYPKTLKRGDFVARSLYGDYLYQVLTETRTHLGGDTTIQLVHGEAVDLEETRNGAKVYASDGRIFLADQVVLALGNLPGEYPIRAPLPFYKGPRYVHIPWNPDALERIRSADDVLLVGAGLTSFDIILQLERLGHKGCIYAISRRGLLPQAHGLKTTLPPLFEGEDLPKTVLGTLHQVRAAIRKAEAQGASWRDVIDSIRPSTAALWQSWPWHERARFMRHLRPFWECARHRLAPETAGRIEALQRAGRVKFIAGRLQALADGDGYAEAVYRLRGSSRLNTLRVGKVINCTGPRSDYSKYQHPLLINLLARRLIDHDPLALGINATPAGEVFRYRSETVGWLYTLGAPLKAVLWECTAVPELRVQAANLSDLLLSRAPQVKASRYLQLCNEVKTNVRELTTGDIESNPIGPGTVLIDVREVEEWLAGHAAGAMHISRGILESEIEAHVPDPATPIILYCAGGNRSVLAADNLRKMGYTEVSSLAGGFRAWQQARLPVVTPRPLLSRF